ncbi:hypothetical protein [Nostoc sp.]|uniref:hypothetical protein n=1 Tax=Nostoc sp. TaxID=1180 RepID=UPI002FF8A29F
MFKSLTVWAQIAIAYGTLRERTNFTSLPATFSVSRNSPKNFPISFFRRDLQRIS